MVAPLDKRMRHLEITGGWAGLCLLSSAGTGCCVLHLCPSLPSTASGSCCNAAAAWLILFPLCLPTSLASQQAFPLAVLCRSCLEAATAARCAAQPALHAAAARRNVPRHSTGWQHQGWAQQAAWCLVVASC
jgi:hypothetical protein